MMPFTATVLPGPYSYTSITLLYPSQVAYKDRFSIHFYLATPTISHHAPLCPAEVLLSKTTQKPKYSTQ